MARIVVAVGILFGLIVAHSLPVLAQTDSDCFPWQEIRDGRCVPKSAGPATQVQAPTLPRPCVGGANDAGGQCICPANTHLDGPSGSCLADVVAPVPPPLPAAAAPQPGVTIVCEGGTPNDGRCACPAGFRLKPAPDNAAGGTCVRTDAENCQGGELTTSGVCLCDRRVVMSGDEYALEYVNGKCVPQRCPIAAAKEGTCPPAPVRAGAREPEEKTRPPSPGVVENESEHRRHCGRGMVRTRSGCVPGRHRYPGIYEIDPAGGPNQLPSYLNALPRN